MATHEFQQAKAQALSKGDKSSAGMIDARVVGLCAAVNACDDLYTVSSCSGRHYLYRGEGVKATAEFARGRVSHDAADAGYFAAADRREGDEAFAVAPIAEAGGGGALWLRYEPLILHARCVDARAADRLIRCARTVFKNVGLQSPKFKADGACVSVVGDEGLDMPLRDPAGAPLFGEAHVDWLVATINEKHARNWKKTERFEAAVRAAERADDDDFEDGADADEDGDGAAPGRKLRFDSIGDIACLRRPLGDGEDGGALAARILASNRKLRVVVAPVKAALSSGSARAPAVPFATLSARPRCPLVTTHREHGVAIVVDLDKCFFSPRLSTERLRVCKAVGRGERVLCLFAGCGPEVLVLAAKTAASTVVAVENNAVGVACLRRSLQTLRRSSGGGAAAARVDVVEGDVLADLAERRARGEVFDRVLAPRPKGPNDGDRVESVEDRDGSDGGGGPDGALFLRAVLPLLAPHSVVHWTDFASDRELPACDRTRAFLARECAAFGSGCNVLHAARAGSSSVAARQYRVTVDFRLGDAGPRAPSVHPLAPPPRGTQRT